MYCPCSGGTNSLRALNHTCECPNCGFTLHVECLVFAMRGSGDMQPGCACSWVANRTFLTITIDQLISEAKEFIDWLEKDINDAEERNDTEQLNFAKQIYGIQLQQLEELYDLS